MPDEETVRRDLAPTARKIIGRKFWPIKETADFLGYSRNRMGDLVEIWGWFVIRPGGTRHVYAVDILAKYEELHRVEFPELHLKWYEQYKICLPPKK